MGKRKMSYFIDKEINCKHCGDTPPATPTHHDTVLAMNLARAEFGQPIIVNSWYRCTAYEKIINGSGKNHPKGVAVDIATGHLSELEKMKLLIILTRQGFIGFGFGENFLHVDRSRWRKGKVGVWDYQ